MLNFNPFNEKEKVPVTTGSGFTYVWTQFTEGGFYNSPVIPAETQKAKGVLFLMGKEKVLRSSLGWSVPKHLLFNAGEQFEKDDFNFPIFARPCPSVPRHGFVDSITCHNSATLNEVSSETFKVEPGAEILITKPIPASYSAILTDGVLTFSGGNDGATAGKDVKYFYISTDPIAPIISLDYSLMLEGEVPFYELVLDNTGSTYLVQVRSAPGVPKCKDYIPARTKVEKILKAGGDLLEWEKLLKEVDPETTIVDHTNGSLASHYAIHAIINRVPIFTSFVPQIGEIIEPTVMNSEITKEDKDKFFKAFCYGFSAGPHMLKNSQYYKEGHKNTIDLMRGTLVLALSTLHNFSAISIAKDYEIIGITLGLFLRTTFTVSAGESRFAPISDMAEYANDIKAWKKKIPSNREGVYKWMYNKKINDFLDDIQVVYRVFTEVSWHGGYGGPKWANCTKSSINLFNACVQKDISAVVQLFNNVLHEEHNGGKYLNKIIQVSDFDAAAQDPSTYAIKNVNTIVDLLSTVWGFAKTTKDDQIPWSRFQDFNINTITEPQGRWAIKDLKVYVDSSGNINKAEIFSDKLPGGKLEVTIPEVSMAADCGCCYNAKIETWHSTQSVPYAWMLAGTKVLTKSFLNKLVDDLMDVSSSEALLKASNPKSSGVKLGDIKKMTYTTGHGKNLYYDVSITKTLEKPQTVDLPSPDLSMFDEAKSMTSSNTQINQHIVKDLSSDINKLIDIFKAGQSQVGQITWPEKFSSKYIKPKK